MTPTVGRVVQVLVDPAQNNGSDVAPAIITRVWNDRMINVKVLLDAKDNLWQTSIQLHDDRPDDSSLRQAAWWPPRAS